MVKKEWNICQESCILIDHHGSFSQPSGTTLDLDQPNKNTSSSSYLRNLSKSTWTCIVEGVSEYCRVVYDLFPSTHKLLVLCADINHLNENSSCYNVNHFENEFQNINEVLKGFGNLGPPSRKNLDENTTLCLFSGVAQGVEEVIKYELPNKHKRIIVITKLDDDSNARSIGNVVWEMKNQHDKTDSVSIDLVVVNVTTENDDDLLHEYKEISPHLTMTLFTFNPLTVSSQLALLVRDHYCLASTIVTGIPMKEEQNAGTSANYDVEVIHSMHAHHAYETSAEESSGLTRSFVTLKWCTPKANSQYELQPCVGAYKITPAEVNSRPAACLTMFLLQGRTVLLEEPKKSGSRVLSHMLSSHGGDVYIHSLVTGRSPLDEPPSISEGVGGKVTDYRVNDFGKLMKENRLAPYAEDFEEDANQIAANRLDRYSKHWPLVIGSTLIFNMQQNLEPLLSNMLKPILNDDEVQDSKKVIYKLQAMESKNDSLPLPLVTLKGKPSKKEDQYKQLWSELDLFVEGLSKTSSMHKKILDCIRGNQETSPASDIKISDVSDPRKTESKTLKSSSRNTPMEIDQKVEKPAAPTDPRRRRRTSDGSTTDNQQSQKSPRSPKSPKSDEPSVKSRRTNAAFNNFSGKTSLLSIWTNHLNLNASRFHEEFNGRKQAINGKYELYKKEADANDTFQSNNTVKEWV